MRLYEAIDKMADLENLYAHARVCVTDEKASFPEPIIIKDITLSEDRAGRSIILVTI